MIPFPLLLVELLFCTIPLHTLIVIIHFYSFWLFNTFISPFHSIPINGTYQKLNYTINYKYVLFYLPIHNDGIHQLCVSNTSKSYSETNILINFDTLNSIQFGPNGTINSWCFHFLNMHPSRNGSKTTRKCIVQVFQR